MVDHPAEIRVAFEHSALWGDIPAGEVGYIECSIKQLAEDLSLAVLVEIDAKCLLLHHADVGLVSIVWEPQFGTTDRSAVIANANTDRALLLQFLKKLLRERYDIVVYPDEYEIA